MPTTPFFNSPDQEDEDEGFSSGLSRDMQSMVGGTPDDPTNSAPPPSAPMVPAAAPANPDSQWARPYTVTPYTPADRTAYDAANAKVQADSQVTPHDKTNAPKWWERALGGLGAGMMAFGHQPGAVEAGQAVVNRRYNQAEQARMGRLYGDKQAAAAAETGIKQHDLDWERTNQSTNTQINADRAAGLNADRRAQEQQRLQSVAPSTLQPDDPANPLGSWHGTTVGGQRVSISQPPDSWLKTPAGKQAVIIDTMHRAGIKEGSEDWKYGLVNGKLKEPGNTTNIHIPSAESQEWNAYARGLGHSPTPQDVIDFKRNAPKPVRGTPEQFKGLDAKTTAAYKEAQATYAAETAAARTPQARAEADANFRAANTQIGLDHSQQLRDLGGIPAEDSAPAPQAASPSAPAPAAAPPPTPAGNGRAVAQQPAAPPMLRDRVTTQVAPQQRMVRDRQGNQIPAIVRNGKWVNAKTGAPL